MPKPLSTLVRTLAAALMCWAIGHGGGTALPLDLESSTGDLVTIEIGQDRTRSLGTVSVCLVNTARHGAKGFDIRRTGPPRFQATPGRQICARITAARHTLYLWKTVAGRLTQVIQAPLDLTDLSGGVARITWVNDLLAPREQSRGLTLPVPDKPRTD